jgi:hypothetical protein
MVMAHTIILICIDVWFAKETGIQLNDKPHASPR